MNHRSKPKHKMEVKNVGSWLVFFLVFWCFTGNALDDKEVIKGVINVFGLISTSEKSDEILVEVLEKNCRLELVHLKRVYKNLGFGAPQAISTTTVKRVHDQELARGDIQKALDSLNPLIRRSLYKCFRENYIVSSVSGKDVGPVGLFPEHGGSLLRISNPTDSSRRQLAEAPSNPPDPNNSGANQMALPPADTTGAHPKGSSRTIIIVVVVATAVGTFAVATIVFLFARKAFSGGSGFCHKNDTTSDNAVSDSSPNTLPYKKSHGKEKMSNQLNSDNFTRQTGVASLSGGSAIASSSAVSPPPGRQGVPLMHPPGWANSLPSKPPASLNPASDMGGPPHPPPPMPPAAPPPKKAAPPPPGPPPPPGLRAPPPPKGGVAPPRPPSGAVKGKAASSSDDDAQAKLKPFFWDKVMANPDHSMVWDQFKSGSFQFNEEMIESLFGYIPGGNQKGKKKESSSQDSPPVPQLIQLIDQKKAQNLSILLRALNVTTEEIRDALLEGHELPSELLETLLKMAPTTEEELKLRLFDGEISQLGTAERFLKGMVDIPFAFKRMEALLFMVTLEEEATTVKENLTTLEAASKEVRSSRLFLKLLEAVLKTGNRMNTGTYRGGAQAFKLDTLLKLADVKGTDGKTTLLHFVVQEIIRSEGVRAARGTGGSKSTSLSSFKSADLSEDIPTPSNSEDHYRSLGLEVVSGLGGELQNVRKAAGLDYDSITGTIVKLGYAFLKTKKFLSKEMDGTAEEGGFHKALRSFIKQAEGEITELQVEEKRIMKVVKNAADYFHGNSGKEEGLRLFVIVRDFVIMLEKVCREVKAKPIWPSKPQKTDPPSRQSSSETPRTPSTPDFRQLLFPAIAERRQDHSSSDDEFDSA